MTRLLAAIWVVALLVSACRFDAGGLSATGTPVAPEPSPTSLAPDPVPRCEDVPRISAPAEWYGDSPVYVANEMPTEEIRAWAARQRGFQEIWIDRDHLGWVTVAFSEDAAARQAELEERFPGVGVVAVQVDWTAEGLEELQRRVGEESGPLFEIATSTSVTRGVVEVGIGVLDEERIAAVEERFAGERVCITGADPADVPPEGPQPQQGDGWRLLADEQGAGQSYRTGIATDEAAYRTLWTEIGLSGERPRVDFRSEVVVWFGAVYGSSCPDLRLDDVVIDRERSLVHAEIVLLGVPMACTADANPRAYLVAQERAELPSGPFAIQLGADDPPRGAPEERTMVDVDLSRPGAVAGPGDVHPDTSTPEPDVHESGTFIEPDYEAMYRLSVSCGIEWLGRVNEVAWRTDAGGGEDGFVPREWRPAVDPEQTIVLTILLRAGPEPVITATARGHSVTYRPTREEPPDCD